MSDIKAPDDSLASYFDDLLGIEESSELLAPVALAAPLAVNVIALPKKVSTHITQKKYSSALTTTFSAAATNSSIETKPRTVNEKLHSFAEPDVRQTPEQKQKLEKLLQTANAQLMPKAEPVEIKTAQPIQTLTNFHVDPNEIQEWEIEPTEQVIISPETEFVSTPFKIAGLDWLENGLPPWAQARFDVLLFQVSGLTLAVPLISLGQIQPITEALTPLFGQADWFIGFQLTSTGRISTVNTAKFVMPERYDDNFVKTAKYVVSINGVPWGLAVDSVNQPITLDPEDVKWRTNRSKRPWLAGVVKDHMCALLDIPRIGQMLIESDKNFVFNRA